MSQPKHIGIIMDGNGRWAQQRHRPRTFGHIKGARVAKKIITTCVERGIQNLTLYTFSSENWLRPATEVSFLMTLLKRYLEKETALLMKQNIRFSTIGNIENLPKEARAAVAYTTNLTSNNTGMHLVFAISYGSRQEITDAVRVISEKVQEGSLRPQDINEELVNSYMQSYPMPSPDIIIRTSGESRLSNFLLWQAAYSELFFTPTLWPEFSAEEFDSILKNYELRERRFGSVKTEVFSTNN